MTTTTPHYFSKVRVLEPVSRSPWWHEALQHGDAYRDHALVWRLFPGDGLPRDFVFRRLGDELRGLSFYVVSARAPVVDPAVFEVATKPYQPHLPAGTWLQFDLRANPTVNRGEAGQKSRRHDVLMDVKRHPPADEPLPQAMEKAALGWLLQRAESAGLLVQPDSVRQDNYQPQRLNRRKGGVAFSSIDYQGLAQVQDPDRLQSALLQGLGHSKAFGCGLLLVKPLRD
ncbi:type I-E CRISPR-associated protein Cas6/Cse3/CasE [Curvibacter lanceolatus]|uniref:type I-E CRISPR-associated protein Cas6/Cse3/CasE n=1 Tax=Curvibacter lanceolatus TaxID=86182 RepID=UPI0003A77B13|nr:type I-E CRISPR-associated protein Cas6/Cse3/CasE [Curvibacter lanceolatus]